MFTVGKKIQKQHSETKLNKRSGFLSDESIDRYIKSFKFLKFKERNVNYPLPPSTVDSIIETRITRI